MTAPTFVDATNAGGSFSSTRSLTLNAGTAADRGVVMFTRPDTDATTQPNSATYGGVAMTAGTLFTDTNRNRKCRGFWLFGSSVPTGSNTLTVTYSDGNGKPEMVAASWTGVDPSSGVSGEQTGFNNNTNMTFTVTSATGDLVVAMGLVSTSATCTPQSGAVERYDTSVGGTNFDGYVMEKAGGSSVTINTTINAIDQWDGFAVSLKASSAQSQAPRSMHQYRMRAS